MTVLAMGAVFHRYATARILSQAFYSTDLNREAVNIDCCNGKNRIFRKICCSDLSYSYRPPLFRRVRVCVYAVCPLLGTCISWDSSRSEKMADVELNISSRTELTPVDILVDLDLNFQH